MIKIKRLILSGMFALASCGGDKDSHPTIEVNLSASPSSLVAGESVTLQWDSRAATTCEARGAWSGAKATAGVETFEINEAGTRSFTLACTSGSSSAEKSVSVTIATNPDLVTADVTATGGGAATLSRIATVMVPPSVLPSDVTMILRRTEAAEFTQVYNDTADLFSSSASATSQLYIRLGTAQPTGSITVTLALPQELKDRASPADEVRVMYKDVYQQPNESHESIEPLPYRGSPTAADITVDLPPEAFYANLEGRFEAYLVLALTPTAQPNSVSLNRSQLFASNLAITQQAANECKGLSIQAPVDSAISSGFGPRQAPVPGASTMHRGA